MNPELEAALRVELGRQNTTDPVTIANALQGQDVLRSTERTQQLFAELDAEFNGLGPLQRFVDQPGVTDVVVDPAGNIWIDSASGLVLCGGAPLEESFRRKLAARVVSQAGKRLDDAVPFADVQCGKYRFHAVLPPISPHGTTISIRVHHSSGLSLAQLAESWTDGVMWQNIFLGLAHTRSNFLISGATGSGKTILYTRRMNDGKRHAAIYVRISQDTEGKEEGVQRQEQDCRELADRLGLHVIGVYRDNDIGASSKSAKARPAYRRMLDDVQAGKFSTILAYSNSRITRRPLEWEELITLADSQHKLQVHTVASSSADFSTADGRMILRYLAAADAAEAERMGERIARAKLEAVRQGRYRGGARPFGYEADGVTPREPEFSAIAEASRRFIAGESLNAIAKDLGQRGLTGSLTTGKPLSREQLREILLRPRNAGLMVHRGKIVGQASWPGAVSEEVFTAVKTKLEDPSRVTNGGNRAAYHLGSSTYLCGICGSIMRVGKSSSGSYRVYRCKAKSHLSRKLADVDEVVRSVVSTRLDVADIPLAGPHDESDFQSERDELAALRSRREQLALDYADGLLDGSQLRIATARLDEQIQNAEQNISQQVSGSALSELATSDEPGQVFLDAPIGTQRAILAALATVTIMPVDPSQRGSKVFDPSTIHFAWKGQDNG